MADPIRFFMDQHFPGPVTRALARQGIDVLTAQDAGRCGLPDPDQLAFATAAERVMVTFDTDYLALHSACRHRLVRGAKVQDRGSFARSTANPRGVRPRRYAEPPRILVSQAVGETSGWMTMASAAFDDVTEVEGPTPYPVPLGGIQIRIRTFDPDSRQIRKVTVTEDFLFD